MLAALAYYDGPGGCWPSDANIAQWGLQFESSVRKARNGLRAKGRLKWVHGEHTNFYELAYDEAFQTNGHSPGNSASAPAGKDPSHSPGNFGDERV